MHAVIVQTDAAGDAVASLELCSIFFEQAEADQRYWKWFVVSMHSGVQGLFVVVLRSQDYLLVQKAGVANEMRNAFESRSMPPRARMDNFLKLYKKLCCGKVAQQLSHPLPSSDEHLQALEKLDELRDEFVHFNSKTWGFYVEPILVRFRVIIQVLELLLKSAPAAIWADKELEARAHAAVGRLSMLLQTKSERARSHRD